MGSVLHRGVGIDRAVAQRGDLLGRQATFDRIEGVAEVGLHKGLHLRRSSGEGAVVLQALQVGHVGVV